MFSCLQILEAFLWFVLITLLNVTLIILTLSVSRLLNLLLRLVAFLLFLNPQCLASISRWITSIASALAGGAMSKLFGGGQKAASGGIQGDVLATDNNTVGMGDAGIKSAIQ